MMDDNYEESVIRFENARNEAMDKWFAARPHVERNAAAERIFEGGFRMAWEAGERDRGLIARMLDDSSRLHDRVALILEKVRKLEQPSAHAEAPGTAASASSALPGGKGGND